MKYKTTRKDIKARYNKVLAIGYCNIQSLLKFCAPFAYCTRAEGWAADVYHINSNTAIATGYAPFGNVKPKYDLQRAYDTAAYQIISNYNIPQEEQEELVTMLLDEFAEEATA